MRVAVVHDWLYTLGGAEKVLAAILSCFPNADLFCLFDVMPKSERAFLGNRRCVCSFLQNMPGIAKNHRNYLPLMPLAIEQFDLSAYDLILSSSFAVAKGVLTGPDQLHLSYVHSPMRYAWDLQHQYLRESQADRGPKSALIRLLLHRMRLWDTRTANGVNAYAANSAFIARRIKKVYGKDARIIYPPVDVPAMLTRRPKEDFFLTASRLVPYKNVHAIVRAFEHLPQEHLIVAGNGPDAERIRRLAGPNVTLAGFVPDQQLRSLMGSARAFIFAAEEDFGIAPVEAQAEGTPIIALNRGGLREIVLQNSPNPTGLFFDDPDPAAIAAAVRTFIQREHEFSAERNHANAMRFSRERFLHEFRSFVSFHQLQFEQALLTQRPSPQHVPAVDGVSA
jgi:glycosyltransferase involved in cell wall biosynthesis